MYIQHTVVMETSACIQQNSCLAQCYDSIVFKTKSQFFFSQIISRNCPLTSTLPLLNIAVTEATAALNVMRLDVTVGLHCRPLALNLGLHARQLLLHLTQLQQAQEKVLAYTYNRHRKRHWQVHTTGTGNAIGRPIQQAQETPLAGPYNRPR